MMKLNSTDTRYGHDSFGLRFLFDLHGQAAFGENFNDPQGRSALIAKVRWFILLALGFYGVCAGGIFSLSRYGFFLSQSLVLVLISSAGAILCYTAAYQYRYAQIARLPFADHLQVGLDLLFVTLLIHVSGGVSSWFWPVYLLVTLEAAILFERRREVFLCGLIGALLYGALLVAEYADILPRVSMPFVEPALYQDALYLTLMWFWVSLLNTAMAVVGSFLMAVIRCENKALKVSEERLVDFLGSANDLIFSITPRGRFLYVNDAWKKALSYDLKEWPDLRMLDIVHPDHKARCLGAFKKATCGENISLMEGRFISREGKVIEVEGSLSCSFRDGEPVALWAICRDITERKQAQAQLYHMAHHDMLTGLPNRPFFIDRLTQAMAFAKRMKQQVAVLFLDLDRFKIINDTLGHAFGDKLLQEMSERLSAGLREADTVARLGGDEFTVLLGSLEKSDDAERVAQKILKTLARPVYLDGYELFITTSIGISIFPQDDIEPLSLIKKADIAMYSAKSRGRNNIQFYTPNMDQDADKRLILENGIRKGLERGEFILHYQPKVDILSGRITAMEALVRWQHPEFGLLPPGDFIPLAEETGLIFSLGERVLRDACAQNRAWQRQGLPEVRVAVNLSGYQLQQKNLIETVSTILEDTDLEGRFLEVEVTETVVMQNPDFAVNVLNALRDLGIHISIDDFGTGYSSLAHLKRFSVNTLKIDKSFVRDVAVNATDAAITTAIIAMGNSLNLKIIAEGVENEGQLTFLRDQSCHEMQGFLFSKPVPPEQVAAILGNGQAQVLLRENALDP